MTLSGAARWRCCGERHLDGGGGFRHAMPLSSRATSGGSPANSMRGCDGGGAPVSTQTWRWR